MEMNFEKLCDRVDGPYMRAVYSYIKPQCYVECAPDIHGDVQGGTVDKVIRDKYGIPVCVRVERTPEGAKRKQYDYIAMTRIKLFEPYDEWVSDYSDFITYKEMDDMMAAQGLYFDEEQCCYVDPKTGAQYPW